MQGVGGESNGSGFGKRGNDEVRKCWWGYVEANEGGGEECEGRGRGDEEAMKSTRKSTREDAEEEARKSAGEEDWMGEIARGMCPRVKGGLGKRGRMDEG